jgi:hypothetical protein
MKTTNNKQHNEHNEPTNTFIAEAKHNTVEQQHQQPQQSSDCECEGEGEGEEGSSSRSSGVKGGVCGVESASASGEAARMLSSCMKKRPLLSWIVMEWCERKKRGRG